MEKIEVWIVTYWDNNQEPIVTAFDNEYNANKCYLYFKSTHVNCIMDKTYLYNKFSVSTSNRT